jgi:hypothetical protein
MEGKVIKMFPHLPDEIVSNDEKQERKLNLKSLKEIVTN